MLSGGDKLAVFREVYTEKVLATIANRAMADRSLKNLNQMLTGANEYFRIDQIHLDRLLGFAKEQKGLDKDRLARLTNPQNFHMWTAVYNELLVAFFFAKKFNLTIKFVSNPTKKGLGDFQIVYPDGEIMVEVKTPEGDDPNLNGPKESVHLGLDERLLRPTFFDGARQLRRGNKNLIVICTQHCAWIHETMSFKKLLYGTDKLTSTWNPGSRDSKPPSNIFVPDGELNKYKPKRHTRVSATASFTESGIGTGKIGRYIKTVKFIVFHNYYASHPISPKVFSGAEQFIPNKSQKRLDRRKKKKTDLALFFGNTKLSVFILNVYNFLYKYFRRARRFYWSLRMLAVGRRRN